MTTPPCGQGSDNPQLTIHAKLVSTLIVVIALNVLCGCSRESSQEKDTYTCPMHPTVISDKPGACPVCGMDLVRKARPGEGVEVTGELAKLVKSPNERVVGSVKTTRGEYKALPVRIEAQGIITYDTRFVYSLPARIGGRLEKVYLKYAFQPVKKGQKVADIYSPELLTAQRELLYLIANDPGNNTLIESAKTRLTLLGATQSQIESLVANKEVVRIFSIFSPYDGYVISGTQPAPAIKNQASSSSMMGESGSPQPAVASTPADLPRAGAYVAVGETLFQIVNSTALRLEMNVPVSSSGLIRVNDEVDLEDDEGKFKKANVDFIQPFLTAGEEFTKVRLFIHNQGTYKIGQLVKGTIRLKEWEALWVPATAILDKGLEKVVFIKEGGSFKPRGIATGILTDGWVEVTRGLASADEIAASAQYMIDSESFIKAR